MPAGMFAAQQGTNFTNMLLFLQSDTQCRINVLIFRCSYDVQLKYPSTLHPRNAATTASGAINPLLCG